MIVKKFQAFAKGDFMSHNLVDDLKKMQISTNLTDYAKQIENYDKEKLLREQEKLKKRMKLPYIFVGDRYYKIEEINISDLPKEKNRVWLRKSIAFVQSMLSGVLKKGGVESVDFSTYMGHIKNKFMETIFVPDYAIENLKGKTVTFADKLTMNGMIAYRTYLLLLYYKLSKLKMDMEFAIPEALIEEQKENKDLDRNKFFKRYFLPKSVSAVHDTMLKEKLVAEPLKKDFGIERIEPEAKK